MTVTSGTDKSDLHKQNVRVCFFSEQNTSVATRNKFSESSVEVRGTVTFSIPSCFDFEKAGTLL
jgi:hypothetical protein